MKAIIQKVAEKHDLKPHDIIGPSSTREIVQARDELCSLLDGMGLSLNDIGRRVNRDHTTVFLAIQRRHESLGYVSQTSKLRPPEPWHVVGHYTRDKAWKIYRGPKWVAMRRGRTPLKAGSKGELEELLAKEYAK